jgi:hypothetical protein
VFKVVATMENETIKLCIKAVIPPRDEGLRKLMHEYIVYKKVLIPKVRGMNDDI